jgi:hypothetical protein
VPVPRAIGAETIHGPSLAFELFPDRFLTVSQLPARSGVGSIARSDTAGTAGVLAAHGSRGLGGGSGAPRVRDAADFATGGPLVGAVDPRRTRFGTVAASRDVAAERRGAPDKLAHAARGVLSRRLRGAGAGPVAQAGTQWGVGVAVDVFVGVLVGVGVLVLVGVLVAVGVRAGAHGMTLAVPLYPPV